jgi:hypothetical protein
MNNVTPTPLVPTFTIPRSVNADRPKPRRLPGLSWLDDGVRGHLVALLGEFAGTFLFLFFAFTGTQVANMSSEAGNNMSPDPGVLLYIALAFGFSLAVNAWVFFRISGGLFNPAVSISHQLCSSDLTRTLGHSRTLSCWSSDAAERCHYRYCSGCRVNRSSSSSFWVVPWPSSGSDYS